ncbi:50S ribosomal protein L15 [Desulfosarcina sp. OttesenSCG-928-A07]|nr:50S ribosomal protein L15 [Desulfosarcina sp. OttesenSCG-928-G17]MDL2329213.1 50S ribosomal protein L15 [Desulfosarcina sp. OttesenSCG-928-A07]
MRLHELGPEQGQRQKRKRVGRGEGSGTGKTSGRGHKGQRARSGGNVRPGYEGGQMPIHRRLPKRGFTNIFKKIFSVVNIRDLGRFEADTVVDEAALIRAGLVKGSRDGIKILGNGDVTVPLTVRVHRFSESAKQKIEAAGGRIEVI